MTIKGLKDLGKEISKEELRKRIASVAVISLGVVLTLGSIPYGYYKEEQQRIEEQQKMAEKNHSLLSYEVLVENCSDGTVKHHFVNANGICDNVSYKECDQYTEQVFEYHGITNKDFVVSYSEIFYNTANYFGYKEMPKTDGRYIFDYNVPYYVMKVTDLSLPNGYTFDALYSIIDLKELETKLDASIYEKENLNKSYYISDLILAEVNGEFMCFDCSDYPVQVDETIDEKDVTKLRQVYYFPSIENDLINLKLSSGMTEVEEVTGYNRFEDKLVFEDITSLDQSVRNDLRGGTFESKNLYDYLTDEQVNNGIVTYEEIIQILNELNERDYQPIR